MAEEGADQQHGMILENPSKVNADIAFGVTREKGEDTQFYPALLMQNLQIQRADTGEVIDIGSAVMLFPVVEELIPLLATLSGIVAQAIAPPSEPESPIERPGGFEIGG